MVRNDVAGKIKPELRHLCQNRTFLVYDVLQDHIEAADPVGSYHNQAVTIIIDLAHFSLFDGFHLLHSHLPHFSLIAIQHFLPHVLCLSEF